MNKLLTVGIVILVLCNGCGVRSRPLPPLTPPELGRGSPTFKRATEEMAYPSVPPISPQPTKKDKKSKANGNE